MIQQWQFDEEDKELSNEKLGANWRDAPLGPDGSVLFGDSA